MSEQSAIRNTAGPFRRANRRLRHLAQSVHVAEEGGAGLARRAAATASIAVIVLIAWSGFIKIDDTVPTTGQVVPKGDAQPVRHADGGTIGEILVAEGDMVKAGQVLVRFSADTVRDGIGRATSAQVKVRLLAEQLRALNTGLDPDFAFAEADHGDLVAKERIVFAALKGLTEKRLSVAQTRVDKAKARLKDIGARAENLAKEADLLEEELLLRKDLLQKKLTSKERFDKAQREVDAAHRKLANLADARQAAVKAVKAAERAAGALDKRIKDRALEELRVLTKRMDDLEGERQQLSEKMNRLEVAATANGLIRGIQGLAIGATVEPGGMVGEIVPDGADTVVEARIPVAEIDRTRPGLPVAVTIKAPGFARYGAVTGALKEISPATFVDDSGNEYHIGTVALDRDHVGRGADALAIKPGMKVDARLKMDFRSLREHVFGF